MNAEAEAECEAGRARRPWGAARVLRWLLAAQVGIALVLAGGDLARLAPRLLDGGERRPALDRPVSPGDQTRRFAPNRMTPFRPALPGTDLPSRLALSPRDVGGARGLALEGEIRPGDAARVAAHLAALAEPPEVVVLHSPGGSVGDALTIGRSLREAGVATRIEAGTICLSACPYMLAAGTERIVSRTAKVGVHQHYFDENVVLPAFLAVADIQTGQAEVMVFLAEMGVDLILMAKAMQTPPEDIYVLLEEELATYRLATDLID